MILRITRGYIVALLSLGLAGAVCVQQQRITSERDHSFVAATRAAEVVTERDSIRNVAMINHDSAARLGDSLRSVERRIAQITRRADVVDKKRVLHDSVAAELAMAGDSARQSRSVPSRLDSAASVREATFNIRQAPYTISAVVDLPEPPDSARMAIRVAVDPIYVDARVSCSSADEHGVRSATIETSGPLWASVRFNRVEQSADVCASSSDGVVRSVDSPRRHAW